MNAIMGMGKRENIVAASLGGAMILMVLALFFATHYQALLRTGALPKENLVAEAADNGLNIPTVDQMCKTAGATAANMAACRDEENQAGEFVIAWMGLNGFITNGAIDVSQIQLAAELGGNPASPLTGPDPSLDPSLGGDPSLGDPSGGEPNIDPATGLPVDQSFDSPAGIAMYCLSNSMDWLQMHDCISRYDPSTRFTGQ
jgi:hypothetical protein